MIAYRVIIVLPIYRIRFHFYAVSDSSGRIYLHFFVCSISRSDATHSVLLHVLLSFAILVCIF